MTHDAADARPRFGPAVDGVLVLGLLVLAKATSAFLLPIAAALLLVLLASGPAERLEARGVPAVFAAAAVVFLPAAGVAALAVGTAPAAVGWWADIRAAALRLVQALPGDEAPLGPLAAAARRWVSDAGLARAAAAVEADAGPFAFGLASVLMLSFFLLWAQRPLVAGLLAAAPDRRVRVRRLGALRDARRGAGSYLATMGWINLGLAVSTGAGLAALGIAHVPAWIAIIALLLFVPYLGPAAIAALLATAGHAASVGGTLAPPALFLVLHAVEAQFVTPWLMGRRLGVGRPALLLAVMAGGWAWGVLGGVLAVPLLIAAQALLRRRAGAGIARALLAHEAPGAPSLAVSARRVVHDRSALLPAPVPRPATLAAPVRRMPLRPETVSLQAPRARLDNRMRIAYVTETYPPEVNGVALTAARAVEHLRARRHPLLLVRPAQAGERPGAGGTADAPEWRTAGLPIPVYRDLRFGIARVATLADRFRDFRAALVHVATEGPLGRAAVSAALRLGLPVTSDFRTNFDQYSRHYRLGALAPVVRGYLRRFHNRTRCTFVPTAEARDALARVGFERLEVVGRGVDLERFAPARRDPALRERWGAGGGPVLLTVGRLAREKNVELALHSFRDARERTPGARLVVVGDGPLGAVLARDWPDAIFAGRQTGSALAAHYASADLFVFPSLSETFGNVVLEALASGLPVVGFNTAAVAEHVRDRENGRVARPGDTTAFRAAVAELAADADALEASALAARRSVAHQDWGSILSRFETRLLETAFDPASTGPGTSRTA